LPASNTNFENHLPVDSNTATTLVPAVTDSSFVAIIVSAGVFIYPTTLGILA
jgi:hypothetical protein